METRLADCNCIESPIEQRPDSLPGATAGVKKCTFCAESIHAEAIKCRYCGEFLTGPERRVAAAPGRKWYFATGTVVMALLCLGPLALPLVWVNPRYKPTTKAVITVAVLAAAVACMYLMAYSYQQLLDQMRVLGL